MAQQNDNITKKQKKISAQDMKKICQDANRMERRAEKLVKRTLTQLDRT